MEQQQQIVWKKKCKQEQKFAEAKHRTEKVKLFNKVKTLTKSICQNIRNWSQRAGSN